MAKDFIEYITDLADRGFYQQWGAEKSLSPYFEHAIENAVSEKERHKLSRAYSAAMWEEAHRYFERRAADELAFPPVRLTDPDDLRADLMRDPEFAALSEEIKLDVIKVRQSQNQFANRINYGIDYPAC